MHKLSVSIIVALFLSILFGCAPQAQPVPIQPNPQSTEVIPPPQDNTGTSKTATVATPTGKIAFVRDCGGDLGWDIFTANAGGGNIADITNNPGKDLLPSWSPDETQIAFQSSREWHGYPSIYTMDFDGKNVKCLTPEKTACQFPSWSPDGKSIAYSTSKLGFSALDIFTMDTNGNNKTPVVPTLRTKRTLSSQVCPSWFPYNDRIAYTSNFLGIWEICDTTINNSDINYMSPDTSISMRYHICIDNICGLSFPEDDGIAYHNSFPALAVSPDGKCIAFDYYNRTTAKRDIYLFTIGTDKAKCLTCELPTNCYFPTWSPDSSKIAFTMETSGDLTGHIGTDIYIMDANGNNSVLLIKDGMFPSWSRR